MQVSQLSVWSLLVPTSSGQLSVIFPIMILTPSPLACMILSFFLLGFFQPFLVPKAPLLPQASVWNSHCLFSTRLALVKAGFVAKSTTSK